MRGFYSRQYHAISQATFRAGSSDASCAYETIAQSRKCWYHRVGERVRQLTRPPFALVLYGWNPLLSGAVIVNRGPHASKRYLSTLTRGLTAVGIPLKE